MPRWPKKSSMKSKSSIKMPDMLKHTIAINKNLGNGTVTKDPTLYPDYYDVGGVHEVRKCLVAWGLKTKAYLFTCVVYIARAGKKGSSDKYIEDLEKAKVWLQYEIDDARAARLEDVHSEVSQVLNIKPATKEELIAEGLNSMQIANALKNGHSIGYIRSVADRY